MALTTPEASVLKLTSIPLAVGGGKGVGRARRLRQLFPLPKKNQVMSFLFRPILVSGETKA